MNHNDPCLSKFFKRLYFIVPLLAVFFLATSAWSGVRPTLSPKPEHASQCVSIVSALEKHHFLGKKLNDELSAMILNQYVKLLDPGKQLFTQEDVDRFNRKQFLLDDELKKGDLLTAFEIYQLYLTRAEEKLKHISALIPTWEKTMDFTLDDTLVIDNDLRSRQTDRTDLLQLWENELKNHIISLILDDQDFSEITGTLEKTYASRLNHLYQTRSDDIFQVFMNCVAGGFDPHSQYFPPRASEDFDIHMSLSLEGIGAVLQNEYEYTKVIRLIPKGPADKSKLLMPGDKIIGVGEGSTGDIKDTVGQRIDSVVRLIRGPKDSLVRLKIIPADQTHSTRTIQIKRDKVKLEEQSAKKNVIELTRDDRTFKIGIIEVPNFYIDFNAYNNGDENYKSTTKDVRDLLEELKNERIDGLIVDLRDNGGGSLKEANELTGLFLKSGPTVQIKTKNRVSRLYDDDPSIEYIGPLLVLINRMSASASEIFAGAVKDYNRGVVVGERSFGKGTVQELQPLGDGKLKITSAKFYRVSGESTQHLGVVPDLEYPPLYKIEDTGESSLDGAMPWDRILRTAYRPYRSLEEIHKNLKLAYEERSQADPGLIYLKKKIEIADELNTRTSLSLNLEKRKSQKKQYEQAEQDIANTFLKAMGKPEGTDMDPKTTDMEDARTILMTQTYEVMADFIHWSGLLGFSWAK